MGYRIYNKKNNKSFESDNLKEFVSSKMCLEDILNWLDELSPPIEIIGIGEIPYSEIVYYYLTNDEYFYAWDNIIEVECLNSIVQEIIEDLALNKVAYWKDYVIETTEDYKRRIEMEYWNYYNENDCNLNFFGALKGKPFSEIKESERVIQICYSSSNGEPNTYEVVKFSYDTENWEIDQYCYDVVETEYGNQRWFNWHEV